MQLSKDAKSILYTLYKEYVDRRSHGFSRTFSKNFESSKSVHEKYFPHLIFEDVNDILWELSDNDFIDGFTADGYIPDRLYVYLLLIRLRNFCIGISTQRNLFKHR